MNELVLAIHVHELIKQAEPTGLSDFDLTEVDQQAYALLPRHLVDDKDKLLGYSMQIGYVLPQILGYFQIVNPEGRILTYQRKGKEKGLLGKWSIGVGGHVNHEDFLEDSSMTPGLNDILAIGAQRELEEELGIDTSWLEMFNTSDDFAEAISSILFTRVDNTSAMHVGLPASIELAEHMVDNIKLDPAEFLNYKWLTPEELKLSGLEFETWSELLIDAM